MIRPIVLSTGGTGGHVFPAISLADELIKRGHEIILITDKRGQRYQKGTQFSQVICYPLDQGKGRFGKITQLWSMAKTGLKVLVNFCRYRPAAVIGFGGYMSAPVMLAAIVLRIPTLLHEQNAVLGRVNRRLSPYVKRLAVAFPNTQAAEKFHPLVVGNPVRGSIKALSGQTYVQAHSKLRIFIMGGSQGAKIFSDVIPLAVASLQASQRQHLHIVQQCRPEFVEATQQQYKDLDVLATVAPFFEDIETQFSQADLVIARAGAMSVAEVATVGRAAIFVPFAAAMDNHQYYNAKNLSDAEAAWVIMEKNFNAAKLANMLADLLNAPQQLRKRALKIRQFAYPDAASTLADAVQDLLRK